MPKQLQTNALLQVTDLTAQDLRGSVKIGEGNNSRMCKAKKKVTERDKGSPRVKERRKKEIGDSCQAMKMPNVQI